MRAALAGCRATLVEGAHGAQAMFGSQGKGEAATSASASAAAFPVRASAAASLRAGAVTLLADWGIVSVSGSDAVKFLHGQTTNDIEHQGADEARWNGYCTPKGRLLTTGLIWRDEGELRYAVSRPLAEPLRKRLSMFVLRAKARVEDSSDAFVILGLIGDAAPAALRALGIEAPAPLRCARRASDPASMAIGFDAVDGIGARWWLVVPRDSLRAVWESLVATLTPVSTHCWRATEILAGQPRVFQATTESFVPQTLNWDVIGGVSFRKGCYPGQEIVARMHYRGKAKRRTFLARVAGGDTNDVALTPGSDVLADGVAAPVGVVVMSAPAPDGGAVLLYEAPIDAALRGGLRTGDGKALEPLPLPYPLPTE